MANHWYGIWNARVLLWNTKWSQGLVVNTFPLQKQESNSENLECDTINIPNLGKLKHSVRGKRWVGEKWDWFNSHSLNWTSGKEHVLKVQSQPHFMQLLKRAY